MSLNSDQIVALNFKDFYEILKPLVGNTKAGYTPVGSVLLVMGSDAPSNYTVCDGSVHQIAEYAELAAYIKDQFGTINYFGGDGTSTFAVPNIVGSPQYTTPCIAVKNIYLDGLSVTKKLYYDTERWLRFDPDNKKGVIIKAGTKIKLQNFLYADFTLDTKIDLSSYITQAGKDYFLFMDNDVKVTAVLDKSTGTGVYIGRVHTLCVNAGALTMISPASPSSGITVNSKFLVKPYREEDDPDFYAFYNKTVTAVSAGTPYDVITTQHPLSGFQAGDILPESVFCKSWEPKTLFEDGMVYDKTTNLFVDIYLQSGTGMNTRSEYNKTHTVSRQAGNHAADFLAVGKRMLFDNEFTSAALGSNECTNIVGSEDKTTVGGHVDTANRRMISAIGVEDACGYLWQWLDDKVGNIDSDTTNHWVTTDGRGSFGQEYWQPYVLLAGGSWIDAAVCGSRSRVANYVRANVNPNIGGRGCVARS